MVLQPGAKLSHYDIVSQIGKGGWVKCGRRAIRA